MQLTEDIQRQLNQDNLRIRNLELEIKRLRGQLKSLGITVEPSPNVLESVTIIQAAPISGQGAGGGFKAHTPAATITPNIDDGITQKITLSNASTTIQNPTGTLTAGKELVLLLYINLLNCQISWGNKYKGVTGLEIDNTTIGTFSVFSFVVDNNADLILNGPYTTGRS